MIGEYLSFLLPGAIVMDLFFGEPSNSLHPVAWIGRLIEFFIPKLKEHDDNSTKREKERENGTIFSISLIITFGLAIHFLTFISLPLTGLCCHDNCVSFNFEDYYCNKRHGGLC